MSQKRPTAASGIQPHPRAEYANRIQLVQFRRGPASPGWEARYKIEGAWSGWSSLGTTNHTDAIFIAIDKLKDREQGVAPPTRKKRVVNTVAEVAAITLARLETERQWIVATSPAKKANKILNKIGRIKSAIVPALGERGIAAVSDEDLERLRQGHTVNGRKPLQGTIAHLNSAWKEVLRDAVRLGYVTKLHAKRAVISVEGFEKGERGSTFTRKEMQAIRAHLTDEWVHEFPNYLKVCEARYLLRALISLMASTGITPGLEVETVTPAQMQFLRDSNGQPALRVVIRKAAGKRKNDRVVWARSHDVWPVIDDMRALLAWIKANGTEEYRRNNPQGYLFARPSDGMFPTTFQAVFGKMLSDLGLRRDPVTKKLRSMYCCRHYYATQSLQDGVGITYLAENLGNSEAMIRKHYAHVITDLRSGQLTGSQRFVEWHERLRQMPHPVDPWDAADDIHTISPASK
jgi:site-specific recombinase XerD